MLSDSEGQLAGNDAAHVNLCTNGTSLRFREPSKNRSTGSKTGRRVPSFARRVPFFLRYAAIVTHSVCQGKTIASLAHPL